MMRDIEELSFLMYKTLAVDYFGESLSRGDISPILSAGKKLKIEKPLLDRAKADFIKYGEVYLIEVGAKLHARFH